MGDRLSAMDASFLYAESASGPMHISSIYVLEGELPYERVLQRFAERLHLVPQYRRKLAQVPGNAGHPKWVDAPDFDLSYHVRHHQLPEGSTLEEGIDVAVALNEPLLDRNHPLWLVHVLSGVPERTLILQMTHHAMIDGASGIEITTAIYDFEPEPKASDNDRGSWLPEPTPSGFELFSEAMRENVSQLRNLSPGDLVPDSRKQLSLVRRALSVAGRFLTRPAITASFNAGIVGPKRRLRYLKLDFGEIREIRRALGGTINDVVLTVVSEAIARYLQAHDEPVTDAHLRIMCPVNVRTENQQGALGNQVSAIFPLLPAWPMEVRARLALVCAEMERIKADEEAQAMTLATASASGLWPFAMAPTQLIGTAMDPTALAAKIPWPVAPAGSWRPPNPGINFVCTNVPGVQVPQYLAGHKVLDTIGILVLSGNIGFSATILSYNKQLFVNYISEPRLMPDVEAVVTATEDAFDELLAEARAHIQALQTESKESA